MNSSRLNRRHFLRASLAGAAIPGMALAREASSYPAPDRELMASAAGGRLYVRVNGDLNSSRPPVVMIHGGPGSSHSPFLNLLAISEDRAVILYDQLDSGLSDRPNDPANWTVNRFVSEVDAVRRALGVKRWHVLGHSWGGTIALEYGAKRPDALAGLILASPLISTRSWIADAGALRKELPPSVQVILNKCDPPATITEACNRATEAFYASYVLRNPRPAALRAYVAAHPAVRQNTRLYETMWGASEFIASGSLRDYNGEGLLTKLNGPQTLFIAGQYDEARPSTLGSFAARATGADFAVVPGSGHVFYSDRPAEALGILRPWLREHDAA